MILLLGLFYYNVIDIYFSIFNAIYVLKIELIIINYLNIYIILYPINEKIIN
jgi:hypothetical protein